MNDRRLNDLIRSYSILDTLQRNIGGVKTLAELLGKDEVAETLLRVVQRHRFAATSSLSSARRLFYRWFGWTVYS